MDVTAHDKPNLTVATDLSEMFGECFSLTNSNGSIGSWNTKNITDMRDMLSGADAFNQPLNWNTQNVTNMSGMFFATDAFNQPLNWNTEKVTSMDYMFRSATAFNQNLGSWNLSSLTSASDMFLNAGMDCANYSRTLIGWATNPNTKNGVNFTGQTNMVYNRNAKTAREVTLRFFDHFPQFEKSPGNRK